VTHLHSLSLTYPHYRHSKRRSNFNHYIILSYAVGLSAVNLTGGTIVTKKMLDMFRRKDDAPEFNEYYLMPGVVAGMTTVGGC
jgi:4TM region of pyridine nucleotide transhydrogenase, mitoch